MVATQTLLRPSLIMETSWEVCNKVGGIYTVLSSRASSMVEKYGIDNILFIGPYRKDFSQLDFIPQTDLPDRELSKLTGLSVYLGTWKVPGRPKVALVDYAPLLPQKSDLYYEMWETYGIRGELGYGDYDESCLFAVAAAKVMIAHQTLSRKTHNLLAIFNEWTTGMGLLWIKSHAPNIATHFITHATSVGRSIAGNGKDLYAYMAGYNGDQMSRELGVEAKHTIEKLAALHSDCFSTVSEVTARECTQLLERQPDVILENGFEPQLVPDADTKAQQRRAVRDRLFNIASTLYGAELYEDTLIVMTSGRYEYRNKGLDLFTEVLRKLAEWGKQHQKDILALITVPAWTKEPRKALTYGLSTGEHYTLPMIAPHITHWLNNPKENSLNVRLNELSALWGSYNVFPLFVPAYLDGADGILNSTYYETLTAADLTIFPSYYEPWGYTPLESIAFSVPTITTDKAGFGEWVKTKGLGQNIEEGVLVVTRNDGNFDEAATEIAQTIQYYGSLSLKGRSIAEKKAFDLSREGDWEHFFSKYEYAFDKAITNHNSSHNN